MKHIKAFSFRLFLATFALSAAPVQGQGVFDAPEYDVQDARGVNLISGKLTQSIGLLSVGPSERPLSITINTLSRLFQTTGQLRNDYFGYITDYIPYPQTYLPTDAIFYVGPSAESFRLISGTYQPVKENGSTLVRNPDDSFTLTSRDGVRYTTGPASSPSAVDGALETIEYPNGLKIDIHWKQVTVAGSTSGRIQSVTRNDGYQLKFDYESDTTPTAPLATEWRRIVRVTGLNNAVDYCDPLADSCSYSQSWPEATIAYSGSGADKILTVTNARGGETRVTHGANFSSSSSIEAIRAPTSTSHDTQTFEYDDMVSCGPTGCVTLRSNLVSKATDLHGVTTYSHNDTGSAYYVTTSHGPEGNQTVTYLKNTGGPTGVTYPTGEHFTISTHRHGRVLSVRSPGQNLVEYSYDSRGNVTEQRRIPKSGSTLPDIVETADYDTTCSNIKKCNKPNWTKDARGNQTDIEYHAASGQVSKVTEPAMVNGVRPQTRYNYTQRYAWIKSSSGPYVQAATPVWVLTEERYCKTGAASGAGCALSGDEVVITYDYGPNSGPNNLLQKGAVISSDGQTRRLCTGFDSYGNRISSTNAKAEVSSCP